MCEYCENGKNLFLTRESFGVLNNDTSTMVITNLKKGIVEISSQDSFSIYDKPTRTIRRIEINFCPICGRNLEEVELKDLDNQQIVGDGRMIIVNKEHNDAYNIRHITNFYIGSDGCSVKVSAGSTTRGGILGKYNSYDDTKKAFEMLMEKIQKNDAPIIYMPSDNDVSDKLQTKQAYHHITGKKTKGHGGS